MPVIGVLASESAATYAGRLRVFHQGLGEAGYVAGRNVAIEYRWAEGHYDRPPALAADLIHCQPSVIFAIPGIAALAAKAATTTIPIVFTSGIDPVDYGLVTSLDRPGGNLTGASSLAVELGPKRLELLHELVPMATTIAYLMNPTNPFYSRGPSPVETHQAAARSLGLQFLVLRATSEHDFDAVFATLLRERAGALLMDSDPSLGSWSEQLAALTVRHAVPAMFTRREAGGRWSSEIRRQQHRGIPTGCLLRRSDSQGRETGRPPGPTINEGRAGDQPQDRQGARPVRPASAARPRRRGDRVMRHCGA
jgi:putative ABC transport system substrate-binding protein